VTAASAGAAPAPVLGLLRDVFDDLNRAGVRYCHWKSNEHLAAALAGDTDVDVLVDRASIGAVAQVLRARGCKRLQVAPDRAYPGIESWVGCDAATATLSHLHVHYQLTLGEKYLKGHRLPWEERFLATRVYDQRHALYVADPVLELIVLVLRQAMKLRARDRLKAWLGSEFVRGGALREFRWLAARAPVETVAALAGELLSARAAWVIPAMLAAGRPTVSQLRALRRLADPGTAEYRLYRSSGAAGRGWGREARAALAKLRRWLGGRRYGSTRTLPNGGIVVAVIGPDGAGKSTLVDALVAWLGREVAVVTTYGGSGTGSAAAPRRALERVGKWWRRLRGRRRAAMAAAAPTGAGDVPVETLGLKRAVWVLALARERVRRARRSQRARGRGLVVLSDRLPQSQFPGLNDGPRLTPWRDSPSRWRRWAAEREHAAFRLAELVPPDLVIKLHVPAEVALARKPSTPPDQVRRGVQLVRDLRYPPATRVVDLDATRPLEDVLLAARRAVWETL